MKTFARQTAAVCILLASAAHGYSADSAGSTSVAGHSMHGEAFNEGPRQKAYWMGGTGKVHFPVSTAMPQAQQFFDQGVGQLHGFWYFEAERSFRQVLSIDPDCAMAYWGMAMANIENQKRAKDFIAEAAQRKSKANAREKLWIDGLADYLQSKEKDQKKRKQAYIRSLENIIHEYPDDVEAKAFLAVRIWQFKNDLPISSYQAVDALLDQVFAANADHPAHHYRIHLWDHEKPKRALASSARCGQAAPTIAHMWHMPGHIYSRLNRYADAVWQQEASSRADHAHMMRDRVMPDQIHNYAHNQEWLTRNFNHIGRVDDALRLAQNLVELPRHPKYNTLKKRGSASFGRQRLIQTLERYELWEELLRLSNSVYLEPTDDVEEQAVWRRAVGLAHAGQGNKDQLAEQIAALEKSKEDQASKMAAAEKEAVDKLKEKDADSPVKGEADESKTPSKDQTQADAKAEDKARKEARKPFEDAIKKIDATLDELNGHRLILEGDAKAALARLKKVKDISKERLAQVHLLAGDQKKAEELASQAVSAAKNEVVPLAYQVQILHQIGKKKEARRQFDALREISAYIDDLSRPAFARLKPIAAEFGYPEDWRTEPKPTDDTGVRPPLESLGPFRWSPSPAPGWALPDGDNQTVALSNYHGRPVIVIFYLGFGCLHCVEQLQSFAPKAKEFEEAGVSLVAVSTDSVEDLKKTIERSGEKDFPIPLLSDKSLEVFQAYRAYDDFEKQPLHGTFLIDAKGLVRWQDISYEPFTDPEFLLKETKRLLGLSNSPAETTAAR